MSAPLFTRSLTGCTKPSEGRSTIELTTRSAEAQGLLWEKLRFHERMIQSHTATQEAIIARHRREVERCEMLLGISEQKGEAA